MAVGEVLGFRQPQLLPRAGVVKDGVLTYIDERPPVSQEYFGDNPHFSDAFGINNAGHVVGSKLFGAQSIGGFLSGGFQKAFIYTGGPLQFLGTLGGDGSIAYDINSVDQVVGTAKVASGEMHAFVWHTGQMEDLNSLVPGNAGWVFTTAAAINDKGSIVGTGLLQGVEHAFLLVPEDSRPVLSAKNYVGITIHGTVGSNYRIEYRSSDSPESWTELKSVKLSSPTQLVIDEDSNSALQRIYRAVLVP